jgi:hypothetical protein
MEEAAEKPIGGFTGNREDSDAQQDRQYALDSGQCQPRDSHQNEAPTHREGKHSRPQRKTGQAPSAPLFRVAVRLVLGG